MLLLLLWLPKKSSPRIPTHLQLCIQLINLFAARDNSNYLILDFISGFRFLIPIIGDWSLSRNHFPHMNSLSIFIRGERLTTMFGSRVFLITVDNFIIGFVGRCHASPYRRQTTCNYIIRRFEPTLNYKLHCNWQAQIIFFSFDECNYDNFNELNTS